MLTVAALGWLCSLARGQHCSRRWRFEICVVVVAVWGAGVSLHSASSVLSLSDHQTQSQCAAAAAAAADDDADDVTAGVKCGGAGGGGVDVFSDFVALVCSSKDSQAKMQHLRHQQQQQQQVMWTPVCVCGY